MHTTHHLSELKRRNSNLKGSQPRKRRRLYLNDNAKIRRYKKGEREKWVGEGALALRTGPLLASRMQDEEKTCDKQR